ncbi:hypothetical protein B566_EDAN007883 [Ephemera danica]|nr:hypothetical protein B566_EDAN007883 [Ephemera danica]
MAMVFTVDQGITYAAAERFRTAVTKQLIKFLYADMRQLGHTVYFWQWKDELKEHLKKQAE